LVCHAQPKNHDQKTAIWWLPIVFAEKESQDREATKSRHIQDARSGKETRKSRAIFQTPLSHISAKAHYREGAPPAGLFRFGKRGSCPTFLEQEEI
jgi:hypothetical protein